MNNTNYNTNYNSNDMSFNEPDNNASNLTTDQNKLSKTRPTFKNETDNFMSESDKKILADCQSESFWFGSLPLMVGVTGFMKYNSLRNLKPLSGLKVFLTASLCFVLGKVFYLPVCQKRLIESDSNSVLVQKLRAKKLKDFSKPSNDSNFEKEFIDQYKDDKSSDFDNEFNEQNENDSYSRKF